MYVYKANGKHMLPHEMVKRSPNTFLTEIRLTPVQFSSVIVSGRTLNKLCDV